MSVIPTAARTPGAAAHTQFPTRRPKRGWTGWGFVGPFMVVFAFVFLAPICYSIWLSLFQNRMVGGDQFVGLDNYTQLLADPQFWEAFRRVALFLVVQVPIMLTLSLLAALAIDSLKLHGTAFFRISIFLPYAVPAVVAALMWGFMYGNRFGLIRSLSDLLGVTIPDPLGANIILISIGNIVTWEFVGYNMLIFYSSLKTIPHSLYEAAAIDGAGEWRIITAIKIPALRGALGIATIFSIIGSFQLFNEPSILQNLAPNAITTYYTPNYYAYNLSFAGQQYNYSATVAIVMGLITMAVAYLVQLRGNRGN
ncbi:carbohydrate ABC transporter permease [Actinomyces sp.]|uniref:carbohydrate ABC transporter permease n=1 Tax=Actinomyces sp. TaxID=29317 RepID=UPI0026DD88DB|nr:sugar ABC transporter permease [Actinomyces sp.]MDO4901074.1 sugar ABC transporter permease [Actinomyces sp.]